MSLSRLAHVLTMVFEGNAAWPPTETDVSTMTRHYGYAKLPRGGRGETIFGALAVVIAVLALIAKVSGLFA